ncbi:hypothetical protein TSMEX_010828 [Taenia solium]|eukprot:TsM_000573400 transcript=TsM_000573400 gene=TsM_000573400
MKLPARNVVRNSTYLFQNNPRNDSRRQWQKVRSVATTWSQGEPHDRRKVKGWEW